MHTGMGFNGRWKNLMNLGRIQIFNESNAMPNIKDVEEDLKEKARILGISRKQH